MHKVKWLAMLLTIWCSVHGQLTPDVIVAQDGTGNYTKISDAVLAAPTNSPRRFYIKINEGNYTETIIIGQDKPNLTFLGDGMEKTIISGNKSYGGGGIQTYDTFTVGIFGAGFTAFDVTFENTAGPNNMQAVALRSDVQSAFYRCRFMGYQDTLLTTIERQFYRDCEIYGTVDFIFGRAKLVLQNCNIYARLPLQGQSNTITAEGRSAATDPAGTVIHNRTITAAKDLLHNKSSVKTFLGRPWKNFSTTAVMQSFLDDIINPKGWLEWTDNTTRLDTIYYAEFDNRGPGAATTNRVQWSGYRLINRPEAEQFSVRNFIEGDKWIPATGIPYFLDLI